MKSKYIDIMEMSLSAYSDGQIRDYINEVKQNGLTEHGFPRLGVNIGILLCFGRRTDLLDTFIEIMDICCEEIPKHKTQSDFSMREICCCLMLVEKTHTVSRELSEKWKRQLSGFDPWRLYNAVAEDADSKIGNWVLFAAVSEFVRGVFCGEDTSEFVDWQLPSQISSLDVNGMYLDLPPTNPMVYDVMPRLLFSFLLMFGYKGKYAEKIEAALDASAELTLKMQSVTGELPFGGRSNQFLHNEAMLASYCELEATRYAKKGNAERAGEFKAAASLASERLISNLRLRPISHIKNRYDIKTLIGCENYGFFNKYMITVASNIYMGYMFADDGILPGVAPAQKGGYITETGDCFHKIFLNAGGYFLELETQADTHYDANGLGRVHKRACSPVVCLSVPFAAAPGYKLERENASPMSICCYAERNGGLLLSAGPDSRYRLLSKSVSDDCVKTELECRISEDITVLQEYDVSESGVRLSVSGAENIGFMLPVFDFDGSAHTKITVAENYVSVEYCGSVCTYSFNGGLSEDFGYYCNRNGRYRVYRLSGRELLIKIEEL